jgi:hypothetical protein
VRKAHDDAGLLVGSTVTGQQAVGVGHGKNWRAHVRLPDLDVGFRRAPELGHGRLNVDVGHLPVGDRQAEANDAFEASFPRACRICRQLGGSHEGVRAIDPGPRRLWLESRINRQAAVRGRHRNRKLEPGVAPSGDFEPILPFRHLTHPEVTDAIGSHRAQWFTPLVLSPEYDLRARNGGLAWALTAHASFDQRHGDGIADNAANSWIADGMGIADDFDGCGNDGGHGAEAPRPASQLLHIAMTEHGFE